MKSRARRVVTDMAGPVLQTFPLGSQWPTLDPFLSVLHHNDAYPAGNDDLGPAESLTGRVIGQDFSGNDGWSMYHGSVVRGFPQHPHRGFETITYVRRGYCDHSDSLGATARFGHGDTQWMTAGAGVQHAEMFPLVDPDGPNPLELFQIWLNLPAVDKMVDPYYSMLWSEGTPSHLAKDDEGLVTEVTVIAGQLYDEAPLPPPPDSWAAKPGSDVAVWHIRMEAGARWTAPAAVDAATNRAVYAFAGSALGIDGDEPIGAGTGAIVVPDTELHLTAGAGGIECLLLQGHPIGEPVARYGPFVMNSDHEIRQTMADYQRTQFGGWPWKTPAPDHGREAGRFAVHADGHREDIY